MKACFDERTCLGILFRLGGRTIGNKDGYLHAKKIDMINESGSRIQMGS